MELSNNKIAATLKASLVSNFLRRRGWEELDEWDTVLIYRRPEQENVFTEIVLPKDANDELYADYMENAARRYARYKGRAIKDVLKEWNRLDASQAVAQTRAKTALRTTRRKEKTLV